MELTARGDFTTLTVCAEDDPPGLLSKIAVLLRAWRERPRRAGLHPRVSRRLQSTRSGWIGMAGSPFERVEIERDLRALAGLDVESLLQRRGKLLSGSAADVRVHNDVRGAHRDRVRTPTALLG